MGLFDIFDDSAGIAAANQGYAAQQSAVKKGTKISKAAEKTGQGFLNQGIQPFQGQLASGQEGVDYYGKLLGLQGQDVAQQTFQGSPGYQFQLDQGLEGLNRSANSRGMLQSGNNTQDILKYSQGLASQDYYNQLTAAQPYFGYGQNAARGIQSGYNSKATLGQQAAGQQIDLQKLLGQAGYQQAQNQFGATQSANSNQWNAILGLGSGLLGLI